MDLHRFLLTACILLTFDAQLFSQSHDKDGYYIDSKGDTIKGKYLNYKDPLVSPSSFSFHATGAAGPINLTPDQCKKASVENDHYISYQGKRETNSVNYHDDVTDTGDVFVDISAFLLELYNDGHYHLFQFNDIKRPNFYVSDGDGPLQELSYKEFMNNGRVVEWPGFHLQLEDFFRPLIQKDQGKQRLIDQVAYNGPALTDLFDKMIGAKKNTSATPKGKYPVQIFVGAGLSANSLHVTGASNVGFLNLGQTGDYPGQTTPLFEAGVRLFRQRNYGRLFYMLRIDYYHFQFAKTFPDNLSSDQITVTYKSNVLSAPLSIGYKLINKPDFCLDLSAGIAYNTFMGNSERFVEKGFDPADRTTDDPLASASFFGEAAIELFNRISIYGAYYSPSSISNSEEFNAVLTTIRFGARIRVF